MKDYENVSSFNDHDRWSNKIGPNTHSTITKRPRYGDSSKFVLFRSVPPSFNFFALVLPNFSRRNNCSSMRASMITPNAGTISRSQFRLIIISDFSARVLGQKRLRCAIVSNTPQELSEPFVWSDSKSLSRMTYLYDLARLFEPQDADFPIKSVYFDRY